MRHGRQRSASRGIGLAQHDGGARLRQGQLQPLGPARGAAPARAPGRPLASRERKTACGRFQPRLTGSGLIRVSLPMAASTARRMRLLTRTGLRLAAATSGGRHGAGRGVDQAAVGGLDVGAASGPAGSAGCRRSRASRIGSRPRAAAGGEPADAGLDVVELGRRELRQQVVDRLGRSAGAIEAQQAEQDGERDGAWRAILAQTMAAGGG